MSEVLLMNTTILLCNFTIVHLFTHLLYNPFQNDVVPPDFESFLLIVLGTLVSS